MTAPDAPRRAPFRVEVLTLFPELIESYCAATIIGRARQRGVLEIAVHDLRIGADDARRTVDDAPFGGGAGMVLMPEPVFAAVDRIGPTRPLYLLSPGGELFDQRFARRLAAGSGFSLLCGRYEGVDDRVARHLVDGEISIGDYVISGGELAALVVLEAACRLVPGALGNDGSVEEESFSDGLLEYPHYTRPADFRGYRIPEVLVSGDHGRVARWRHAAALARTLERRPDLITARGGLSEAEVRLLVEHGYPFVRPTIGPKAPMPSGPGPSRGVNEQ
jgi:tRNA (guanine37-N1)-methyltransferase